MRNLEREIGNVCRKVARKVVQGGDKSPSRSPAENVTEYLGVMQVPRHAQPTRRAKSAWSPDWPGPRSAARILSTEVAIVDGKGKLTLTGKLGDVMQESAQAAMSYVRSRWQRLGLARDFYRNIDIHVHVPEGAIPKDGPSAGITMATAIASALSKIPVRRDIAMTGEITLRGKVLPIGGLKEKLLAAHRAGIFEDPAAQGERKGPGRRAGEPAQRDEAPLCGDHGRRAGAGVGASAARGRRQRSSAPATCARRRGPRSTPVTSLSLWRARPRGGLFLSTCHPADAVILIPRSGRRIPPHFFRPTRQVQRDASLRSA